MKGKGCPERRKLPGGYLSKSHGVLWIGGMAHGLPFERRGWLKAYWRACAWFLSPSFLACFADEPASILPSLACWEKSCGLLPK